MLCGSLHNDIEPCSSFAFHRCLTYIAPSPPLLLSLSLSLSLCSLSYADVEWVKQGNCNTPESLTMIMDDFKDATVLRQVETGQAADVVEWFEQLNGLGIATGEAAHLQVVTTYLNADDPANAELRRVVLAQRSADSTILRQALGAVSS